MVALVQARDMLDIYIPQANSTFSISGHAMLISSSTQAHIEGIRYPALILSTGFKGFTNFCRLWISLTSFGSMSDQFIRYIVLF